MENFEDLIGPKPEDREQNTLEDEVAANGEPLWMAFLEDPNALSVSKEEVEEAKNELAQMKNKQPEVIKMCAHKSIQECKELVQAA